ncbi:MAG: hypothetical protein V3U84_07015 [Thiotrichaceae bacterium]
MTSSEADRFMLEHPEVAVSATAGNNPPWVAWDKAERYQMRACGNTREHAISEYKHRYHPEKLRSAYNDHIAQQAKVFADSAKYRRIVDFVASFPEGQSGFIVELRSILGKDLYPTHRDRCKQELS